jgi:PAS domain S-box-containing protein
MKQREPFVISEQSDRERYISTEVVESSEIPVYSSDFDETISSWNDAAKNIYGYPARDIIGEKNSILFPPECRKKEARIFELAKQGQYIKHRKTVRIRKDGSRLLVSVSASPVINRQGEIIAITKIERVISEHPNVTEQLTKTSKLQNYQQSEIEAIYQTAPIGLGYIDDNLRFIRVNKQLAEIIGTPAEKHIGHAVPEILPFALVDKIEPFLRNIMLTGVPALNIEITGETSAYPGISRTWVVNYYPLTNTAGKIMGINVIVQETTEKKQAEEKIRLCNQWVHNLINSFFAFVALLNPDGSLIDIKGPVLSTSPEIKKKVGANFTDTFWWDWAKVVQEKLRVSIDRCALGETVNYDTVARVGEDQFLVFDFQLTPIADEKGKVTQLISSGINISEHFEPGINSVHHKQLSFAGELVGELAHEIKNPLAGIQGAIDILIGRRTSDNFEHQILETIRDEIIRINDVLKVLLKRVRPRLMYFVEASLTETIRDTVQLTKHLLAARRLEKKIKIEVERQKEPFIMKYDIRHIKNALLNLLINAVDAIGEKSGFIKISLSKSSSVNYDEVVINVFNSGSYIEKRDLPNLFTPFYTTKKNGTGLGLSAVKRIAMAHGGYCTVKSVLNKGTTFSLHLPMDINR